jgi:antitoxin CptB
MRWILPLWQGDAERFQSYMNRNTGTLHMTGLARTSADLDPRRRRILYRCWHRGIREMDLVFGSFAEAEIADLSDTELDEFEQIMAEDDHDLHAWITGAQALPTDRDTPLFARVAAYKPDFDPVTTASLEEKLRQP